jgi:hypothetical protein
MRLKRCLRNIDYQLVIISVKIFQKIVGGIKKSCIFAPQKEIPLSGLRSSEV